MHTLSEYEFKSEVLRMNRENFYKTIFNGSIWKFGAHEYPTNRREYDAQELKHIIKNEAELQGYEILIEISRDGNLVVQKVR